MSRSLASVQKITSISTIDGADKIELAKILGWDVVVRKDQFKPDDVGVFFEIDAIVPDKPCFEFMKERKFRVKSISLRKTLSQGLFMSFDDLGIKRYPEGKDLTDILGVTKWEPPEDTGIYQNKKPKSFWWKLVYKWPILKMFRKKCGSGASFPPYCPKTDETRLQAFGPGFLETYKDLPIAISQKMDGSSTTFVWNKGKFSVASRNVWMIEKNDTNFWKIVELTKIDKAVKEVFGKRNVCLQGELVGMNPENGSSIQGNKYKFTGLRYFLFGIFDSDKKEYFTPQQLIDTFAALQKAGATIEIVPQLVKPTDGKTIKDIGLTVDDWLKYVDTRSIFNPDTWNEGIVVRSLDNKPYGVKGMAGGRWSAKVISNKFLLQYGL